MSERRCPVQIATAILGDEIYVYALCDDGSIWWKADSGQYVNSEWVRVAADIPQDNSDV